VPQLCQVYGFRRIDPLALHTLDPTSVFFEKPIAR
jgi:hypothetical protein